LYIETNSNSSNNLTFMTSLRSSTILSVGKTSFYEHHTKKVL